MFTTRLDSSIKHAVARSLNPQTSDYSSEGMIMAVARKKHQRLNKSADFSCVVIEDDSEFQEFLEKLHRSRDLLKPKTRFQILYLFESGQHWFVLDCQFDDKKQFSFFLIDPAIFGQALRETTGCILQTIPDASINFLALTEETKIQRCYDNCGTFALDIAFGLSRTPNTFGLLAEVTPGGEQIKSLSIDDLPVELGFIIRNMHSISSLEKLTSKKDFLSNSHTLVSKYFNLHMQVQGDKRNNHGIDYKREIIKIKSLNYFVALADYEIAALFNNNANFIDYLIGDNKNACLASEDITDLCVEQDPYETVHLTSGYVGQGILGWISACRSLLFSPQTNHASQPPYQSSECRLG